MVKVRRVVPAGTITRLSGATQATALLELVITTVAPPAGAGACRTNVPVA